MKIDKIIIRNYHLFIKNDIVESGISYDYAVRIACDKNDYKIIDGCIYIDDLFVENIVKDLRGGLFFGESAYFLFNLDKNRPGVLGIYPEKAFKEYIELYDVNIEKISVIFVNEWLIKQIIE